MPFEHSSFDSKELMNSAVSSSKEFQQAPIPELNRELFKEIAALYLSGVNTSLGYNFSSNNSTSEQSIINLQTIGHFFGLNIGFVSKNAVVVVIGNISAGKSTFVNWFIQEAIQKTGMAIETSGFTVVTHGKCLNELNGESTLILRPYLLPLVKRFPGFLENLSLKTCPSVRGQLSLLDIIDTPGLADGELKYPFDVESAICEMHRFVDLFLIFFDPIGQALGKRILSVVQRLYETCPDKIRFCLSKVDDILTEEERIKVMCQTTQSLTAKINSRHGFDLIPIYIPGAKQGHYISLDEKPVATEKTGIVNRIHDLAVDIQKTTQRRVQQALHQLFEDIELLSQTAHKFIQQYEYRQKTLTEHQRKLYYGMCCRILILFIVLCVIVFYVQFENFFPTLTIFINDWLLWLHPKSLKFLDKIRLYFFSDSSTLLTTFTVLFIAFLFTRPFRKTPKMTFLEKRDYNRVLEYTQFLMAAQLRWNQLNTLYLNHTIPEQTSPPTTVS